VLPGDPTIPLPAAIGIPFGYEVGVRPGWITAKSPDALLVRFIFSRTLMDWTLERVADRLSHFSDIGQPEGGWNAGVVRAILRDERYCGRRVPLGSIEPIVTEEAWAKAAKIRARQERGIA
jgi:hypothetical protein